VIAGATHWAGALMVAGSVLLVAAIGLVSSRPVVGQALTPAAATLMVASSGLLLLAMPAMFAVQGERVGALGLAGHVLLTAGLLLPILVAATPLLHPAVNLATGEHPVVFLLGIALTVGLLLTGIATFGADVLPRPAAALLLAATAGFFFVFFVAEFLPPAAGQVGAAAFGILLAIGFGWIGVALWRWA
jgi:hypothetical protein